MNAHELNHQNNYATPEEIDYLRTLTSALPAGINVVMLGAGPGVMALALKEGNPHINLTIVDNSNLAFAEIHLAQAGHAAALWLMDSADAAQSWGGNVVTLLIVDADHSYEAVKRDVLAWLPHLGRGSYLFFHDYDAGGTMFESKEQYPGVMQAVGEMIITPDNDWRAEALVGTSVVFKHE